MTSRMQKALVSMQCNKENCRGYAPIYLDSGTEVECKTCHTKITIGKPVKPKPDQKCKVDQLVLWHDQVELVKEIFEGPWFGRSPHWYRLCGVGNPRPELELVPMPRKLRKTLIWIYSPTYGSLQLKDLKDKPLNENEVWQQSYVSWDRSLKTSEKKELFERGKLSCYPDEFYLVGKLVSKEVVLTHLRQIKNYKETNYNGPEVEWRDSCGNDRKQLKINFVSGPIVDIINQTGDTEAANTLVNIMREATSPTYSDRIIFKKASQKHAWNLVLAVRKYAKFPNMKNKVPWLSKEPNETKNTPQRSLFDFAK